MKKAALAFCMLAIPLSGCGKADVSCDSTDVRDLLRQVVDQYVKHGNAAFLKPETELSVSLAGVRTQQADVKRAVCRADMTVSIKDKDGVFQPVMEQEWGALGLKVPTDTRYKVELSDDGSNLYVEILSQ